MKVINASADSGDYFKEMKKFNSQEEIETEIG